MDTDRIIDLWGKNHDFVFAIGEKKYFAYHDRGKQYLCDDGEECKSKVVETDGDLLREKYNGEIILDMIARSEIEYIY